MRISAISVIKQNAKKTNSIVRIYFASFGINTEHLFYKSRLVDSTCCVTEFEIHSPLSAVFAYFCINFVYTQRNVRETQHTTCAKTLNKYYLVFFQRLVGPFYHFPNTQVASHLAFWYFISLKSKSKCTAMLNWDFKYLFP